MLLMKFVLTIAGSDPTGGAGIQADLKTISSLGCYGLSAVTAITSQTSSGVKEYVNMDPSALRSQIIHLYNEFKISAVKVGMLATTENLKVVASVLAAKKQNNIVVDPILFSSNRVKMIDHNGIRAYWNNLFPIARVITPNIDEASVFSGIKISSVEEMMEAGRKLAETGAEAILIKGGHLAGDPVDVLYYKRRIVLLPQKRIRRNIHGAGCTLSSAIATLLAKGFNLENAIRTAQNFTSSCIRSGFRAKKEGKYLLKHF